MLARSNYRPVRVLNLSRRDFLKLGLSSSAGLTLAIYTPSLLAESSSGPGHSANEIPQVEIKKPDAFIRIDTDNTITIIVKHIEFGQGTFTGLPTLVAEELDADWAQIRVQHAPLDVSLYNNLNWGPVQGTGGSSAIANSYYQMRYAGATVRAMLLNAASEQWHINKEDISIVKGQIKNNRSGQIVSFGDLAMAAAKQAIPKKVGLKKHRDFEFIGRDVARKDCAEKINGTAIFTQDIKLPDMLVAVVAHPPKIGLKLKQFDATRAEKVKGVKKIYAISTGVVVLATDFWPAHKARQLLDISWDETDIFKKSSQEILYQYKQLAKTAGLVARNQGNIQSAFKKNNANIITANYEFPYLAHAALEPMNCVIQLAKDSCELWYGAQIPSLDARVVADITGLSVDKIKINTVYAGGSFGRRANPQSDYVAEAANIAKHADTSAAIKMIWTREDDMHAGYYRPLNYHQLTASHDGKGNITAWHHRIVGQSIMKGTGFEAGLISNGIDSTSVEGAVDIPYDIANLHVDLHTTDSPITVQWWRSVGHTHTAFSTETFLDEIAFNINKDPLQLRRELLQNHPRHLAVLELVAKKSKWGTALNEGRGRGVAVHKSFNSYVAEVAEVTVKKDGTFRVDKVFIAIDCGVAVNPDVIRAQMEGGTSYGLSAVFASQITIKDGLVEQSNFDDYEVLRINQMPDVEVFIVDSDEDPTGVGEPATPPIAPAVQNAIAAATGKFHHTLPLPKNIMQ